MWSRAVRVARFERRDVARLSGSGDFGALPAVLDPDNVPRADSGTTLSGGMRVLRGVEEVTGFESR